MRTALFRKVVMKFVTRKHEFVEDSAVELSTVGGPPIWRVRPMDVEEHLVVIEEWKHICRRFSTVQNNLQVCSRLASATQFKVNILPRRVNGVTDTHATLLSTVYAESYNGMLGDSSDSDSDEKVDDDVLGDSVDSDSDEMEELRADVYLMNKTVLTIGEHRRLDIVRTEQMKLIPLYVARMTYTNVEYNKMFFHVRYTEEHLVPYVGTTPGEFFIKDACTGDVGTIHMSIGSAGHALVSGGWKKFAQEHHYIEGRVCVFIFDEVDGAIEVTVERF